MPEPDGEFLFEMERKREEYVEGAWNKACGHSVLVTMEDDIFGGIHSLSAFCVAPKHEGSDHLFSTKAYLAPEEIIAAALPDYEKRPF